MQAPIVLRIQAADAQHPERVFRSHPPAVGGQGAGGRRGASQGGTVDDITPALPRLSELWHVPYSGYGRFILSTVIP